MTITLAATRETAAKARNHGGFSESAVKFHLSHGQTAGFLIQHVTRTFEVYRLTNGTAATTRMTPGEIGKYIGSRGAYPAITEYWEAWVFVKGDESETDTFALTDFSSNNIKGTYYQNGTIGKFTERGTAIFYASHTAADTLEKLGFVKDRTITGGLLYTTTEPDPKLLLSMTASPAADRETAVKWNDTKDTVYKTEILIDTPK